MFLPHPAVIGLVLLFPVLALAQQTTGGITGVVADAQGGILAGATVSAVGDETGLKRSQVAGSNGYYDLVNLPIGHYTLTVGHDGFQTQVFPGILVQADRTATLNMTLTVGAVSTSVTVSAAPLMNATDTTNGYVLDRAQIESVPLPTGSFTGCGDSVAGRECGAFRRNGSVERAGECADLGEWTAGYVEQL